MAYMDYLLVKIFTFLILNKNPVFSSPFQIEDFCLGFIITGNLPGADFITPSAIHQFLVGK